MPFIDTSVLKVIERLPGWYGRYFHSPSMTFAHYDFKRGSFIHQHFHPQEEVYEVIEGELELAIDGVKQVARPGFRTMIRVSANGGWRVSCQAVPEMQGQCAFSVHNS
jgi:hypothetical protein